MNPLPSTTLKAFLKGFKPGEKPLCWYVNGAHLYLSIPDRSYTEIRTFVLIHKDKEVSLGYLCNHEGSLTFLRKRTLRDLSLMGFLFPHLLEMEGHPYPLPQNKSLHASHASFCLVQKRNHIFILICKIHFLLSYITFLIILVQHFPLCIYQFLGLV